MPEDDHKLSFTIREIEESDLQRGFFQTLSNLTEIGHICNDFDRARSILSEIRTYPFYKIFVAVNDVGDIIGSITLLIEQKFVHNGSKVGHIEDVVTRKEYEGKGVGSALVQRCIEFARAKKCYKVILNCSRTNIPFYQKVGFREYEISMRYDVT
jgi:glucosamine-phosphate N-acetyltransferase